MGDRIEWLDGAVEADCPACGAAGAKPRVLRTRTLGPGARPITLARCDACGLRFFADLGEPRSFEDASAEAIEEHFELGIGLRGSVECLGRIDRGRVRTLLEVGCGTGLTLDFARHALGWQVLGADTSAMSARAVEELGVPIAAGLLGESAEIAAGAWDLVFACEVIEHVTRPADFLAAVRAALAPGGAFLLRTPAAEGLAPGREERALVAILSPGYHPMLHTAGSLERLLRAAGFGDVHVLREGDTLHAAAAVDAVAWEPDGTLPDGAVPRYLDERADTLATGLAARQGLLQQLANEAVNRGDGATAARALARLDATLQARHGAGLDAAADAVPPVKAAAFAGAFVAAALAAELAGDRARAADRFLAAAAASEVAAALLRQLNSFHEGAEQTRELAERRAFALTVEDDPEGAAALLRQMLAGPERDARLLELFAHLVGAGAFDAALELAPEVERLLAPDADGHAAREARWALAMLLLHAAGRPADAAGQFARATAEAADADRAAAARFHEGYARWHAGDRDGADPLLRATLADPAAAAWAEQAAALLAAPAYAG